MSGNVRLSAAKVKPNDEFYTQYNDIEAEMNAYVEYNPNVFRDKTILLPCDDPEWSNFTKYFVANFKRFGLKKLISTSYAKGIGNKQITLFEQESVLFDKDKHEVNGKLFTLTNAAEEINFSGYLEGEGDFRSEEVKALRDEADIIITNPPFSLFREFLPWIMDAGKKFIIMGNKNAITYKEVFPLLKDNKMWIGSTSLNGGRWMIMPSNIEIKSDKAKINERGETVINVPGVCWFANIDHGKRHQPLLLDTMAHNLKYNKKLQKKFKQDYEKIEYKFYDEYDAIDIPFVECIPSDFNEIMGVPITFLDKYCPEQFKIIGLDRYVKDNPHYGHRFTINGKETYARILIKKKEGIYSNENRITY